MTVRCTVPNVKLNLSDGRFLLCTFLGNYQLLPLQKGLELPGQVGWVGGGGVWDSVRPTNLKKCVKFNCNFRREEGMDFFSGTTHFNTFIILDCWCTGDDVALHSCSNHPLYLASSILEGSVGYNGEFWTLIYSNKLVPVIEGYCL